VGLLDKNRDAKRDDKPKSSQPGTFFAAAAVGEQPGQFFRSRHCGCYN